MIDKSAVEQATKEWLEGKEYFLVGLDITADDRIVVEIDHKDGVWVDDCADLSRFIESRLDREEEDYELEVGSAGLGQPFRVRQQYEIHEGHNVEVLARDGRKHRGVLTHVGPEHFGLLTTQKIKEEGMKRPKMAEVELTFAYDEVKATKYLIDVK